MRHVTLLVTTVQVTKLVSPVSISSSSYLPLIELIYSSNLRNYSCTATEFSESISVSLISAIRDSCTKELLLQKLDDPTSLLDFQISSSLLYYKSLLVIPDDSYLKSKILIEHVCEDISLDFIVGLPKSGGFDSVLVELFRANNTRLRMGTSYRPQSGGQTEAVNHCLEAYLPALLMTSLANGVNFLFGLNIPSIPCDTNIADLEEQMLTGDAMLKLMKDNLLKAQSRMKAQADFNHWDLSFNVGNAVLLRLQRYRQKPLVNRPFQKLSPSFFGPYKVICKVGPVSDNLHLHEIKETNLLYLLDKGQMHSERFVEFGADENCHYGAEECKRKLGIKPNKLKRSFLNAISSDAALKLVASQVAAASTKEKAPVYAKHVYEDCHCGAVGCKRKLGIKPNKLKRPFSGATTLDAVSKLVESLVVAASTEEKALVSGKHVRFISSKFLSMEKQQSFQAAELSTVGPAHLGKGKEALLLDSNLAVFICTKLNKPAILVRQRANAYSERFVQFGADEDCHCGVEECKRKLKIKPNILKRSFSDAASSDAALKLVTSRVVAASIEEIVYL
ncbi:hypothetical protein BC332_01409 [Capsicum chinense]|nr:hypothetical protein BC332_01409 [Capsicum chinense]